MPQRPGSVDTVKGISRMSESMVDTMPMTASEVVLAGLVYVLSVELTDAMQRLNELERVAEGRGWTLTSPPPVI